MAVEQREAARGETVIHSDHGRNSLPGRLPRARTSPLVPSMGPIGDCNDNALIEALWSRMRIELLDTRRWTTSVELGAARRNR
jgi:putative transposase